MLLLICELAGFMLNISSIKMSSSTNCGLYLYVAIDARHLRFYSEYITNHVILGLINLEPYLKEVIYCVCFGD